MYTRILFLALLLSPPLSGQTPVQPLYGATAEEYQAWFKRLEAGQRVSFLDVCWDGKTTRFAALAVKDGKEGMTRLNLTAAEHQREFDELVKMGYRLTTVCGYHDGKTVRFASAWVKDASGVTWSSNHNLTPEQYRAALDNAVKRGSRIDYVRGYPTEAGHRLSVVFRNADDRAWEARYDQTAPQLEKDLELLQKKGFRPLIISGYRSGAAPLFASVLVAEDRDWSARHSLSPAELKTMDQRLASRDYHLTSLCGYVSGGALKYAAVWVRQAKPSVRTWPATGKAVPELQAYEDAMLQFMKDRDIPAGTLAVMKDGKLLLSRGYGFADAEATKPIAPDALMRFGSISKPITAAAIHKLVGDGKLTWDTKAFDLLGVEPPPGQKADPRLKDITIKHLIDHTGGWDRDKAMDPSFHGARIAKTLGIASPPGVRDMIRYMAGQPLQFAPGERKCYSNFGYCVLGRVIEKVTGQTYVDYIRKEILAPAGITSIELGRSLPRNRNPREPFYSDPGRSQSVFASENGKIVPAPDGTFSVETMDAHGGLIGSAVDLVKFLEAYWITGEPRKGGTGKGSFFGSLPGTWAMVLQRPDGVNIAVLFNQRADPSGKKYEPIREVMDKAAEKASIP